MEESARLARFFTKLFGELEHLQGDSIVFRLESDSLRVLVLNQEVELKSIRLKPSWYEPIYRWLADRAWSVSEETSSGSSSLAALPEKFVAAIRLPKQVVITVGQSRGPQVLRLSSIELVPISIAIERVGFLSYLRENCYELACATSGLIIVSAPDAENLKKSTSAMLSISQAIYLGSLSDPGIKNFALEASVRNPLIVTVQAGDALDALLKLKEFGYDFNQVVIAGSICQGFVRRCCPHCLREAAVDSKLVEVLPPELRPPQDISYRIGRGCAQCDMSGYFGSIGVQSLLVMDVVLREKLIAGEEQLSLVRHLYPLGLKSLLEDGVMKVTGGLTTYATLYNLTRTVPQAFLKVMAELRKKEAAYGKSVYSPEASLEIDATKVTKRSTSTQSGVSAQNYHAENEPLFAVGPDGKIRVKPLLLIVEDDPDQQNILELLYRSAGYDTITASDGMDAMAKLEQDLPDLIVTDLMMPRMDGSELTTRLKAHPVYKQIPVLVLTVVSDGEREYSLLDLGADDYCEKTIQRKILLKRTEKLIKRNR